MKRDRRGGFESGKGGIGDSIWVAVEGGRAD